MAPPTEALNNLIKRIKRIGCVSPTSTTTASEHCYMPETQRRALSSIVIR
jgi:hypothetical protein